jgi:hypothetical protein
VAFARNRESWHGEVMNRSKDGNYYWADALIIPIADEEENIVQYLSVKTLISDRMETSLDIEKKFFLLYELINNSIDRLTAPLADCKARLSVLEKKKFENISPAEFQSLLHDIRTSTDELTNFQKSISSLLIDRSK